MVEVMKYENLALKEGVTQEEINHHNHLYEGLFKAYSKTDLANDEYGYKTKIDKMAPEYQVLCNQIKSIIGPIEISEKEQSKNPGLTIEDKVRKSIDAFVKQNKMTKTDTNSLNFYKKLNKRGVGPGNANISYLRFDILDVFGYDKLKTKNITMKDSEGNILLDPMGNKRELKISQNLENLPPENVRGFAIKSYNHGEKVWNRLHGKK